MDTSSRNSGNRHTPPEFQSATNFVFFQSDAEQSAHTKLMDADAEHRKEETRKITGMHPRASSGLSLLEQAPENQTVNFANSDTSTWPLVRRSPVQRGAVGLKRENLWWGLGQRVLGFFVYTAFLLSGFFIGWSFR